MQRCINLVFLSITAVCLWGCPIHKAEEKPTPNILWILAEDLSPDLACYGKENISTPFLDDLAKKGVRYTHVFATAPVCSPSRTAIATGMYQNAIGAYHMRYPDHLKPGLPEGVGPITEILQEHGYTTANLKDSHGTGKKDWMFNYDSRPFEVEHWAELKGREPFYAQVSLRLTHRPFVRDTLRPVDLADIFIPPYYPDHEVVRRDFADYYESVQVMDRQVGDILNALKEQGFYENTVVIFFSDHGRPMIRDKCLNYDSGLKIPMIIFYPETLEPPEGFLPGSVDERMISAIDISATTLAMAGIHKPSYMQGRIFLGPQKEKEREYIFSATDRIGETFFKSRSVRSGSYRYTRNYQHHFSVNSSATAYRKGAEPIYHVLNIMHEKNMLDENQIRLVQPMPDEEFYNLKEDPFEMVNLVGKERYQDILGTMRHQLDQWMEEENIAGLEEDPDEIKKAFEKYRRESEDHNAARISDLEKEVRQKIK